MRSRVPGSRTAAISPCARALVLDCYPSDPRHYFDINLRDPAVRARYAAQFGLRSPVAAAQRLDHAQTAFPGHALVALESGGLPGCTGVWSRPLESTAIGFQ